MSNVVEQMNSTHPLRPRGLGALLVAILIGLAGPARAQSDEMPVQAPAGAAEGTTMGEPRTEAPDPPAPRPEDAPPLPSFQRGSGLQAGGPANELNTRDARAREELPGGSASDAIAGRDLYHGNYCGHGQRGVSLPPTDELDAACKRHDECYTAAGTRSCTCDRTLKREATAVANTARLSRELRARAASVAEAAELMECSQP